MAKPAQLVTGAHESVTARATVGHKTLHIRVAQRRLLLMVGDLLATLLAVCAALWGWSITARVAFTPRFIWPHAVWIVLLPLLWLVLASVNNYYSLQVASRTLSTFTRLAQISVQLFVFYAAIFFFAPREALPRLFIVFYALISLLLISAWRAGRVVTMRVAGTRRRAIIVGTDQAAELIWHTLTTEAAGDYEILGCVPSTSQWDAPAAGLPVLGQGTDLVRIVRQQQVSELIVTYGDALAADVFESVMSCYTQGIVVAPIPTLYEEITGRVPIDHIGQHLWAYVLPLEGYTMSFHLYLVFKRLLDIVCSLIGLIVFLPVLPFLALAIKLNSPGPVFYTQQRVGRGGRLFGVIKLRSMVHNAERGSGPKWAQEGDPRVTSVGRMMRKTRLDEVPQLINVLRGDMSLVGPRPERPEFVAMLNDLIPYYRSRLVMKPGLTGWAQIRFRYGSTKEDALYKLQYDLYYSRHQSILLDLLIMARTIGTIVRLQGT